MPALQKTQFELVDDTAWITIDDGKANVMSSDLLDEIAMLLDEARGAARSIVLAGRPGIFSAGFDMNTLRQGPGAARGMMDRGIALILKLLQWPTPVIACCTGHAYPMGAFLLLASDLRVGAAGDWRIGFNETAIGLTLPRFALALADYRLTPSARVRTCTAAMFDPHDAVRAGYLDEVVSPSELRGRCADLAAQLNRLDSDAYRGTKARMVARLVEAITAGPY